MAENRVNIVPFDMKYLNDYYKGLNAEITKFQWPDPFLNINDARAGLQVFLDEMRAGETLLFSVLSGEGTFVGSVELHGLSGNRSELGIWILESEQHKGYAYAALNAMLEYAHTNYHKTEFYYEVDIRNTGSVKLLQKFGDRYEIIKQGLESFTTGSGKELKLQGYVLKRK